MSIVRKGRVVTYDATRGLVEVVLDNEEYVTFSIAVLHGGRENRYPKSGNVVHVSLEDNYEVKSARYEADPIQLPPQRCPPHHYELRQTTGKETCIHCYEEMPYPFPPEDADAWVKQLHAEFAFNILADSFLCTVAARIFDRFSKAVKQLGPKPQSDVNDQALRLLMALDSWDYQNGNPDSGEFDREKDALRTALARFERNEPATMEKVLYDDLDFGDCCVNVHGQRFVVRNNEMKIGGRLEVIYEDSRPWSYGVSWRGDFVKYLGKGELGEDYIRWPDGSRTMVKR